MMQFGFYFDQSRCTGCYACTVACRDWHDTQDTAVTWRRIITSERGNYPDVRLSCVSLSCCHCENPACEEACPAGAIAKRQEDGIMTVDREACLGGMVCGKCKQACPYGAPQFSGQGDDKMQMCTFCVDRLSGGQKPACVDACPMRALDCGPLDELRKKYGSVREAEGFSFSAQTKPSIIIKPRY